MSQQSRTGIYDLLQRSEDRLDAVERLKQLDQIERSLAREIVPELVWAYETESSVYTRIQIIKQIDRISERHPDLFPQTLGQIAAEVVSVLDDFSGSEPSEDREISLGTDILVRVIDATSPEESVLNLNYSELRGFVERGDARQRALCYRLLGRTATGEAVKILLRDYSHEVESVKQAQTKAIDDVRTLVFASIDGDGPLDVSDAVVSFTELYSHDQINPERGQVLTVEQHLSTLSTETSGDTREAVLSAIERLARRNEVAAESMISECFDRFERSTVPRDSLWQVLEACARGAPEILLEHDDELVRELDGASSEDTLSGLEVVFVAVRKVASVPAILADPVLRAIGASDKDVAVRAVQTAGRMGFHPIPEPVVEVEKTGSTTLSTAASETIDRLERADPDTSFLTLIRDGDADVSLFAEDSGEIHLKYRSRNGRWVDIAVEKVRRGIVEDALTRIGGRDDTIEVVYPYFEPRDVVILALAAILDAPRADRDVVLYSPGSQTQWGTKGEVREELRRFGLSDIEGDVISAIPIPSVVPEAYVWDGEVKFNSEGDGPGQIFLTKDLSEMEHVDELDLALLNQVSRRPLEFQDDVETLRSTHTDLDLVNGYSFYTRNDTEGRPRYGPPSELESTETIPTPDLIDPVIADTASAGESWRIGDDELRAFGDGGAIRIEHVETGPLSELFEQLFDTSAKLRDTDAAGAGGLIFSRHLFFERLPIPADDYDEWVRDRYEDGDRFVPPLIEERIADVKRKAGNVENLEAVQPLNTAKQILDRVHDQLRDENPLYEALESHVSETREEGGRLAIFSESPKNAQLLRETLESYGLLSGDEDRSGKVDVVSPNSARNIDAYDTLLICGPLHPQNAGFYVHPRVDETLVLTYNRSWAGMIERHARDFVDLLNDALGDSDYTPFSEPTLAGDIEELESEGSAAPEGQSEGATSSSQSSAGDLDRAMWSASVTECTQGSGTADRELRHYVVETPSGESVHLTSHERVLREVASSTGREFEWVNPAQLSGGETILTIPEKLRKELWKEYLKDFYEGEREVESLLDAIRLWQEGLVEIWERVEDELELEDRTSDGEMHRAIYEGIDTEIPEFDRVSMTVRHWFDSAREAEDPINLVQNPELVLGPRSYRDIKAVGTAFGYTELIDRAEEIEGAMETLRRLNQRLGHQYRESIRMKVNSGTSNRISEMASRYEVVDIREHDDGPVETSTENVKTRDLDEDVLEKILDLVELAPTKNGELAARWGFDSGSEVYQLLSTELKDYYERNDDKLVVPTDEARRVAAEAGDVT